MVINIRIDNDTLSVTDPMSIVGGSKNYYRFEAVFTSDWDDLTRYVVFPDMDSSIVMDAENFAVLPEVLTAQSGVLKFGIIGVDSEENLRIATNYAKVRIIEGAKKCDAAPPPPPVSDAWEEYVGGIIDQTQKEKLSELTEEITSVKNQLDQTRTDAAALKKTVNSHTVEVSYAKTQLSQAQADIAALEIPYGKGGYEAADAVTPDSEILGGYISETNTLWITANNKLSCDVYSVAAGSHYIVRGHSSLSDNTPLVGFGSSVSSGYKLACIQMGTTANKYYCFEYVPDSDGYLVVAKIAGRSAPAVYETRHVDGLTLWKRSTENAAYIINCAEGHEINVDDSACAPVRELTVYGASRQAEAPSTQSPQAIIPAHSGNGGFNISAVNGSGVTIPSGYALMGIPAMDGGNYTDENGQRWISDELCFRGGEWEHIKRIKKLALPLSASTSDTDWHLQVGSGTGKTYFITLPDAGAATPLCSFAEVTAGWNGAACYVPSYKRFLVDLDKLGFDSLDAFLSFLAENGGHITYVLGTFVNSPLDVSGELFTLAGATTIANSAEAYMQIKYIADSKKYIDKKFEELKNAILSIGGNI